MHCHVLTETVHTARDVNYAIGCEFKEFTLLESDMVRSGYPIQLGYVDYVAFTFGVESKVDSR